MFESASLDHRTGKAAYKREEPQLREALLDAQYELVESRRFPVLILIAGVEGAGKGETVNLLNEWMDPRHIATHAFFEPTDEERERPPLWRFWRALPPRGSLGVFFGAWHTIPILRRVERASTEAEFAQEIAEIVRFEKMLCDEGVLLLKYWFHLSRAQQKKRLTRLEKDPATRWRVSEREWRYFRRYEKFERVCEPFLRKTSTGEAPWIVIPGANARYRSLAFGRHLLAAVRERLQAKRPARAAEHAPPLPRPADAVNVLRALQLDRPLAKSEYKKQLEKWQGRLNALSRDPRFGSVSVAAVFEGNDAAGKGGAIRRVTGALDARIYHTVPVGAPSEEERAQPYLWRFWRQLPRRGRFAIVDRSWYGRVLVERVERLCAEADWMRAYAEINDFEQALARHGVVVAKFWLAISKEEQHRRFQAREKVAFKRFKITAEDWRNRKHWDRYERAVCDMVDRTSTLVAPWTLVEANNKYYARIKVLSTLCEALERALQKIGKPERKKGKTAAAPHV
jgi:AMP-polyphosphate phosphotransferase